MDCKYPGCEAKDFPLDLEPKTGKPITCWNNCPTMRKAELMAKDIETITVRPSLMQQHWAETAEKYKNKTDLKELVRDFFEVLDIVETNDDGERPFHPNHISSCRVFDTHKLNAIMPRMKELANAKS